MPSPAHAGASAAPTSLRDDGIARLRGEVVNVRILGDAFWGIAEVRPVGTGADSSGGTGSVSPVKITGKLLGVSAGDTVEVEGSWSEHPKYGAQLKARAIKTLVPSDSSGVIAWLEGRLPGVGRTRATEIVERFGVAIGPEPGESGAARVWQIIETQPDRLLEIKGITPRLRDMIVAAYEESRGDRDRVVRLRSWGLTDSQLARVVARWKTRAEDVLRANPYRLAEEIPGFGFKRADAVAQRMGLPHESPARIRAAVEWCLETAENDGHMYLPVAACAGWVASEASVGMSRVVAEIREMVEESEAAEARDPGGAAAEAEWDRAGAGGETEEQEALRVSRGRVVRVAPAVPGLDDGIERIARVRTARAEERVAADAVALVRGEKRNLGFGKPGMGGNW